MSETPALTPLVLVVDDQEATSQSIDVVLRPKGHVVLKAYSGHQALDLAGKVSPDAILVCVQLPDMDGIDLVRRLKGEPTIHPTTPILMMTHTALGRAQRLEALEAGSWDILSHPVDPSELILRMDTFVRAKQAADRAREEGLTDPGTGFYNVRGILRRTKEINADATRSDRPLTCVAFGPNTHEAEDSDGDRVPGAEVLSQPVAAALRHVTRVSDTIGKLGPGEFVVLAPGTDQDGAVRLADRVLEALSADSSGADELTSDVLAQIRAGFCSVDASDSTSAEDLLLRATMALRRAQADDGSFRVRSYDA
jgi:diguanylate cyclase (GGDEF)-like protein